MSMEKEKLIELGKEKNKCSSCGACFSLCPKKAISFKEDERGFEYPFINEELCVKCGLCVSKCTYNLLSELSAPIETYAAKAKNDDVFKRSASGGVYATLALNFINDGFVAGAVGESREEGYSVYHKLANDVETIKRQQGSKYVQSQAYVCYEEINKKLKEGKQVLFSGTPCQVDAVKRVTGNPDNLYTIDLICHGVPSIKMYNDFLKELSKVLFGKIEDVIFRDKEASKPFSSRIIIKRGKKIKEVVIGSELMSYYKYFLQGSIYRDNCYHCRYATNKRIGDITIGDYWGIEKHHPEFSAKEYWSCILVNTEKGRALLDKYSDGLQTVASQQDWVIEGNKQLSEPSHMTSDREIIIDNYKNIGYKALENLFRKKRNGTLRYIRQLYLEIRRNNR